MTTLRALLRQNPNYRYTWMAQVVSEMGDYFNNIAVFALVMEKSGSGLVVTGVMLSRAIPAVLAGPVAGVLLDRLDRRRIMIVSDLVRALIALAFVLTIHQPRPVAALRAERRPDVRVAVLHRRARRDSAHHRHARRTACRQLADPDHAVGHAHRGHAAGRVLGAAWLGYRWAFVINSLSFVFSACAASGDRRARRAFALETRGRGSRHASLAGVSRGPRVHALRASDDGHGDDFGGLVDGRRRGADSVRAVRRPGLPPRRREASVRYGGSPASVC